jgi:DNA-binding beta-propeller fold protein YncE
MLYIAMAGPHQIWRMSLEYDAEASRVEIYAGNGREDIVDGPLLPGEPYEPGSSSFAQPSGLASDGERLYVADTEGSSIRAVPFDASQEVETVVGTSQLPGGRLFVFGDRDGQGLLEVQGQRLAFRAEPGQTTGPLLQHAIGVAWDRGKLYVADTYNNKIKLIDPQARSCTTIAGTGEPGRNDGPAARATFDEPAGLGVAGGKLYVADTNNHLIRVIDLEQDNHVSTLTIEGLAPPLPLK